MSVGSNLEFESGTYPAAPCMGSIINAAILSPSASSACLRSSITPNATTFPEGDVDPTCGTKGPNTTSHQHSKVFNLGTRNDLQLLFLLASETVEMVTP